MDNPPKSLFEQLLEKVGIVVEEEAFVTTPPEYSPLWENLIESLVSKK